MMTFPADHDSKFGPVGLLRLVELLESLPNLREFLHSDNIKLTLLSIS